MKALSLSILMILLLAGGSSIHADWEDTGIPDSAYFLDPLIYYTDCDGNVRVDLPIYVSYDETANFFLGHLRVPSPPAATVTGLTYGTFFDTISNGSNIFEHQATSLSFQLYTDLVHYWSGFPPHTGKLGAMHLVLANHENHVIGPWEYPFRLGNQMAYAFAPTYTNFDIVLEVDLSVPVPGDVDCNGIVEVSDPVFLINYIFAQGDPPYDLNSADCDANCIIEVSDAVYLITYIFASGAAPQEGCVE